MAKRINTKTLTPFPCTACGLCCRNVHLSELTAYLDRGDGVCGYFDSHTNLCTIYDTRPLICRVEDYYQTYLKDEMSWNGFVQLNLQVCRQLQNNT